MTQLASPRPAVVPTRPEATLHWLLRIACAMCFVGHGAWGLITKAGWLPFYAVFGIGPSVAWRTMPIIGAADITLGAAVLLFPFPALLGYLVLWTLFTALLRPLAGMGWWELLERAGNYGPPLALLVIARAQSRRWFERIAVRPVSPETLRRVAWILRASIALLLIGHGGFALIEEKKLLLDHWRWLGVPADLPFLHALGAVEMAAGFAAFLRPSRPLLISIAYWKLANELLYPLSSGRLRDGWEWVERGGDYLAPFALLCVLALLLDRDGWRRYTLMYGDPHGAP